MAATYRYCGWQQYPEKILAYKQWSKRSKKPRKDLADNNFEAVNDPWTVEEEEESYTTIFEIFKKDFK